MFPCFFFFFLNKKKSKVLIKWTHFWYVKNLDNVLPVHFVRWSKGNKANMHINKHIRMHVHLQMAICLHAYLHTQIPYHPHFFGSSYCILSNNVKYNVKIIFIKQALCSFCWTKGCVNDMDSSSSSSSLSHFSGWLVSWLSGLPPVEGLLSHRCVSPPTSPIICLV